jgi:hypothetical protein
MNTPLVSFPSSIDAPVEGWDAFHAIDNMPPTAAIILDNMIPGPGTVDSREGSFVYADLGTGLPVETVASFESATDSKLITASNGGIWEIIDDPVTPVVNELAAAGTFANSRWQTMNFRQAGENGVLIMCNGVDDAQIYDGTSLTPMDTTGSDPAVTPDFIGVLVFKGRAYYWKEDESAFYYAQAGGYQGEIAKFDLGSFIQRGGKLVQIVSWTMQDSGDGRDDFIVYVFSTGEVLVYQGDDPETAGFWEQVGRYLTAEPLTVRGATQYGADTILMTKDGYVALSTIIQQGRTSDVPAFSRLIHKAVTQRTSANADLFGWTCELFPKKGLFVFNVPLSTVTFEQHVMNTITSRWCRLTDLNVTCLEVHEERLFGGTPTGEVKVLLESTSDSGKQINCTALYAYQYMDAPGVQKHLTAAMIRSTIPNPADFLLTGFADFEVPVLTPIPLPTTPTNDAIWSINPPVPPQDVGSFWDEDYWAGGATAPTTKGWQNVSAHGFAVSLLVRFAVVNETVVWRATNLRYHLTGAQ